MTARIVSFLCAAALVAAQEPTIRIDTRLVEIDVVVRDNKGAVAGLTQNDFAVFDNGKRQQIASFSIKEGGVSSNKRPLRRGAVSNRINARGEEPSDPTVILWDVINTEMNDQAWVRNQVLLYLRSMASNDRVALYSLSKSLRILRDFTDDPETLQKAVAAVKPEQSVNLSAGDLGTGVADFGNVDPNTPNAEELQALIEELRNAALTSAMEMQWYALRDRALITMSAFQAMAEHLRGIPGRKKVIWISGGFPALSSQLNTRLNSTQIESLNLGLQIEKAIQRFNDANVAVYPLDPRGLTTQNTALGFGAQNITGTLTGGLSLPGIDTMNLFASGTGGRAFYGANDIQGSIRQVFEDFQVVYSLGFYPSEEKLDGSYHSLAVKLGRKGTQLRHRKGYFASDTKTPEDIVRQNGLSLVMQNELDATGVGLTAFVQPVPDQTGMYYLELTIDTGDLHFQQKDGLWQARVDYATQFSANPGLTGTTETILISFNEQRYREALAEGLTVSRGIETGGAKGRLRVAIQDRNTGRAGSVRVQLGVEPEAR